MLIILKASFLFSLASEYFPSLSWTWDNFRSVCPWPNCSWRYVSRPETTIFPTCSASFRVSRSLQSRSLVKIWKMAEIWQIFNANSWEIYLKIVVPKDHTLFSPYFRKNYVKSTNLKLGPVFEKFSWNQVFITTCSTVWKLREFTPAHFWQKFRESNSFTKEITK